MAFFMKDGHTADKKLVGEILLVLILTALTIYDVTKLTVGSGGWFGYPKEAKMSISFNDSIAFPNMTFCMTKNHAWSHFSYDRKLDANESRLEFFTADHKHHKSLAAIFHGSREAFLKEPWTDEKLIMSAYHAIAAVNYLEREFDAERARYEIASFAEHSRLGSTRQLVKSWLEAIQKLNVTFADFQDKVGKEVIRRSVMMMARVVYADEEQSKDFIPTRVRVTWISLAHLCFQPIPAAPNATGFDPITVQGWFFKMDLKHNGTNLRSAGAKKKGAKDKEKGSKSENATKAAPSLVDIKSMCKREERVECMAVDFYGRPTIFSRSMQGKGRAKDSIGEGLCPGDFVEVNVHIHARYTMMPNDKKPTACISYDDDDGGDSSEYLCRSRCRMQMLRELCSCTGLTFQNLVTDQTEFEKYPLCDYGGCGANATALNITDKECADKCLPSCQQTRFRVVPDVKGHTASSDSQPLAVTKLIFIWGSFEYLRLDQDLKWDLSAWLAALGGSMGLYLGLSALTLMQLFTWLAAEVPKKFAPIVSAYTPDKRSLSRSSSIYNGNNNPTDVNNNPDGSVQRKK